MNKYQKAVKLIKSSSHITGFTGAGISVESGIPPFRGENGIWSKYDPGILYINSLYNNPDTTWKHIKEIFYDFFGKAKPNEAHKILAKMEKEGLLETIITQNIDNLHQDAGSKNILEFHGNSRELICLECGERYKINNSIFDNMPPLCKNCGGILKPDFVFFGESIPEPARKLSFKEAELADLFIVIGTTGEIQPASLIPLIAKENGAKIIEINTDKSNYTDNITDIFLQEKATDAMQKLFAELSTKGD